MNKYEIGISNFTTLYDAIKKSNWVINDFSQYCTGEISYSFERMSEFGETILIEGNSDNFEEFLEEIRWHFESSNDDYNTELLYTNRVKGCFPYNLSEINTYLYARKLLIKELFKAVERFKPVY